MGSQPDPPSPPQIPGGRLPRPAEWPDRPSRSTIGDLVFLALLALVFSGVGAGMLVVGAGQTAAIFIGLAALVMLILAAYPLLRVGRGSVTAVKAAVVEFGETGVQFKHSAWWFGWVLSLIAGLGGGTGALAWYLFVTAGEGQSSLAFAIAVVGLFALPFALWVCVEVLRGNFVRGYALLTPRGIHHRGVVHRELVAWDDVFAVSATSRRGMPVILVHVAPGRLQWAGTSRLLFSHKRGGPTDGTPSIELPIYIFAVNPVLAYHALQFYQANPQHRGELAGEAGLRRIRAGDLLPG